MRKKALLIVMAGLLTAGMVACSDSKVTSNPADQPTTPVPTEAAYITETPVPTEVPEVTATPVATKAPDVTVTPIPTEQPYQIVFETYEKTDTHNISYPVISNWALEEKQQEWNEYFKQDAQQIVDELEPEDTYELSYEVAEQTDSMLSLTISGYADYKIAPHPYIIEKSIMIDMKTGEQMTLADVADPDKVADILLNTNEYEAVGCDDLTMDDLWSYNFLFETPTKELLASSLSHFDQSYDAYGEGECMGQSYIQDGNLCLIMSAEHALGDYITIIIDGDLVK